MANDRMKAFLEHLRAEGLEPTLPKPPLEQRYHWILQRRALFEPLIALAHELVKDSNGRTLVFLARDALPLMEVVQQIAMHQGVTVATRAFEAPLLMLPEELVTDIWKLRDDSSNYARHTKAVVDYVARTHRDPTLLHRYIQQELAGLGSLRLVDTGFWGTVLVYVDAWLGQQGAVSDFRQFHGPPGSPAFRFGHNENDPGTFGVELSFSHQYEFTGVLIDDNGVLRAERRMFPPKGDTFPQWYACELQALSDLTSEYLENDCKWNR